MGFVASILGGGAARHAANLANVVAQQQAQLEQQTGQQLYNDTTAVGNQTAANLRDQSQFSYNSLMGQIPSATAGFQPIIAAGGAAAKAYQNDLGYLSTPFQPTQAQLDNTPGYQFALNQGLESTQNGFAARGLGISGAAMKGAAAYATGLAQQTYAQDAGIYQNGQATIANALTGGMNAGTSAASASGNIQSGLAQSANSLYLNAQTAADQMQNNAQVQGGDFLQAGVNTGGASAIAGQNEAAAGQIAYNNALASGINILANGINQGVGLLSSPSSTVQPYTSGSTALTSAAPTAAQAASGSPLAAAPVSLNQGASGFYGGNNLVLPGAY
jgi:hypothetical protein